MDESFIYERMKALSGDLERAQYRDISKAFEEVVRYNKRALEELKQQISRELRDVSERFYLYGAAASIWDAPMVNDFLFPMSEEPPSEGVVTLFFACSLKDMEELFSKPQTLTVETEEGKIEVRVQVRPCRRYLKKIQELERIFYDNGIYWRTPYLPYVGKFGDVHCPDFDLANAAGPFHLKGSDIPVSQDMVPLWNVEPMKLKCTVFPIPAVDEQNYRHTLRLPFPQDGYVVCMAQTIKNVYLSKDGLELIAEEKMQKEFDLYRIAVKRDIKVPHYPLTSNFRQLRHIDRQADHAVEKIRSRAEISRMVSSYEAAGGLKLIEIEEGGGGNIAGPGNKYQFSPGGKERLLLKFLSKEDGFLLEDKVSFLVSEVQEHYPHLAVTGQLLSAERGAGQ